MENALKRTLICLLVVSIMSFMGCGSPEEAEQKAGSEGEKGVNGTENNDKANDTASEVTFLNYYPWMGRDDVILTNNEIFSAYIPDSDSEKLFAFLVEVDHYYDGISHFPEDYPVSEDYEVFENFLLDAYQYRTAKVVELMKKAGLTVLEDYPYCCYNQDNRLLGYEQDIDRLTLGLCAVVGTMEEIKCVFDGAESLEGWYCYVWSAPRPDLIEKIKESGWTGTTDLLSSYGGPSEFYKSILGEENQVTMKVDVKK